MKCSDVESTQLPNSPTPWRNGLKPCDGFLIARLQREKMRTKQTSRTSPTELASRIGA